MVTRRRSLLLAFSLTLLAACGGGDEDAPQAVASADLLARQRAAAYFIEGEFARALDEVAPLADRPTAELEDLVHAASAALEPEVAQFDRAKAWVDRAAALDPNDQRVRWARYRIAMLDYDLDAAVPILRAVLAHAPDDIPTKLALADCLYDTAEPPLAEIEELYRQVVAVGIDFGGSWYKTGLYKLGQFLGQNGRADEAEVLNREHSRLVAQGIKSPSNRDVDRGTFGSIPAPRSEAFYPRPAAALEASPELRWTWTAPVAHELAFADPRGIEAHLPVQRLTTGDASIAQGSNLAYVHAVELAREELLVWGGGGLATARWSGAGWDVTTLLEGDVTAAACLDVGDVAFQTLDHPAHAGDGDVDYVAARAGGLTLIERKGDELVAREVFAYATPPRAILAVDFDHEGDVDLLLVGADGATLLRNDAIHEEGGAFVDVTAEAGLPRGRAFDWCFAEDLDHDNDVDLVMGGPGGVFHASNERGGRFSEAATPLPAGLAAGARGVDHDGDGWADLRADDGTVWIANPSGAWRRATDADALPGPALFARETVDVPRGAALCDRDGDGAPDLVTLADGKLVTRSAQAPAGATTVRLMLEGLKDNHRGLGAIIEVVLGDVYRREYARGGVLAIATHGAQTIPVLRVTWPNGVFQNLVDLPAEGAFTVWQRPGLIGSCPFLYTWNGEEYVFISDVLGITPLGLPMAPGMLVPPDHDEYVLVRGDQMAPKDGAFEIQITEELREVTYLDEVRLQVVDHPADVEVFPNERFTFPPFPEHHVHTLRGALAPRAATGSDGRDWTRALRADDEELAQPFTALGGQFQGLADPWFVELAFDEDAVRAAEKLRLVLNGWLYWTDASVNVAAARHPRYEFIPPLLMVPDGAGGWREAGVLGFPAGKLKTMVVDVTDAIDRDDPRVRVFTSLQLYWDSIRLAIDADDAELVITDVVPSAATLWERGFSKPVPHSDYPELETFAWDELDEPRWDMHPGAYTRYGDCLELLTAVDDRFVIFGAGDALTVRFPATELPPLRAGWTRDYLIFFDGWAKDRDPNTLEALYVEPLPFHGMSGYPYGADERYPTTPEHRAYRADWNTRPATRWIPALAPGR